MSAVNGDRSRHNKMRRKKIARRADMRQLRAEGAAAKAPARPAEK